jgi:hypothetical protein
MEIYGHNYIVPSMSLILIRASIALILTSTNNVILLLSLTVLRCLYELYALKNVSIQDRNEC